MKFEYVGFYPLSESLKSMSNKKMVGTVHIYCVDGNFDIRGIKISKHKNSIFFVMPEIKTTDQETGLPVSYPVFSWTKEEDKKEMFNWLHTVVKPQILKEAPWLKVKTHPKPQPGPQKRPQLGNNQRGIGMVPQKKNGSIQVKSEGFSQINNQKVITVKTNG